MGTHKQWQGWHFRSWGWAAWPCLVERRRTLSQGVHTKPSPGAIMPPMVPHAAAHAPTRRQSKLARACRRPLTSQEVIFHVPAGAPHQQPQSKSYQTLREQSPGRQAPVAAEWPQSEQLFDFRVVRTDPAVVPGRTPVLSPRPPLKTNPPPASHSLCSSGQAPWPPHDSGTVPLSWLLYRDRVCRLWKDALPPQAAGSVPAHVAVVEKAYW